MTAVRIRHENDTESRYLADVPFADLDSVIPTINSWGIESDQPTLVGQFVYPEVGNAYFEVVLCGDGDGA